MAFKKGKVTGYQLHIPMGNHKMDKAEEVPVYLIPNAIKKIIVHITLYATNSEICKHKGIENSTYLKLRSGELVASLEWWKDLKKKVDDSIKKSCQDAAEVVLAQQSLPGM